MQLGMKRIFCLSLLVTSILSLQSCMDVAVSGAQVVYNRHNIQKNLSDQYISLQAYQALHLKNHHFDNAHLSVSTFNGDVLLAGQAPESWQRNKAEKLLKKIPDVKKIYNLTSISNPSSVLTRMSDVWITTKVKAKLIASNDVDPTRIKVVTENGAVYLMGILPPDEADAAVKLASHTSGVQSVVKIFSYLRVSKK